MFRLQRNKPAPSSSPGKKIDFNFSRFHALQVPKGWSELLVSIFSVETGKAMARSKKAMTQNGQCQWTDTLSGSIWIPLDDNPKGMEDKKFKFVVAMGSARSSILGEATVHMTEYMSTGSSIPVSLPLKNCVHGTTLKMRINCVTPRTELRNKESNKMEHDNVDAKSNGSNHTGAKIGFTTIKSLDSARHLKEPLNMKTSISTSATSRSCDSPESVIGSGSFSPGNDTDGDEYRLIGLKDSDKLQNGVPYSGNFIDKFSQSNSPCPNRSVSSGSNSTNNSQEFAHSSSGIGTPFVRDDSFSISFLEVADDSVEELQEVKNLSTEHDVLGNDAQELKVVLEESVEKQRMINNSKPLGQTAAHIQEKMKKEIKFQQEKNFDLAQQLKKSQESNLDLVSVLQELEESVRKHKFEIETMSSAQLRHSEMEHAMQKNLEENQARQIKLEEENQALVFQLHQLQESENILQVKVQLLEQALDDKVHEIESDRGLIEDKLLSTGDIVMCNKLPEALEEESSRFSVPISRNNVDLIKEIETLKGKVEELERDCNELTDENLELLVKLKESNKNSTRGAVSCDLSWDELSINSILHSETGAAKTDIQENHMEDLSLTEKHVHGEDQLAASETSKALCQICKQLQMVVSQLKEAWCDTSLCSHSKLERDVDHLLNLDNIDEVSHNVLAESIFKCLVELNKFLEAKCTDYKEVTTAQAEIRMREGKMAGSKKRHEVELEQQLQDMLSRLTEAQEELDYLKIENPKLQASVSSLLEECSSLHKFNAELKEEQLELQDHCMDLEAKLEESQTCLINYTKKVADLEEKLASAMESEEHKWNSELHTLLLENRNYKEQLILRDSSLHDMRTENTIEVENLLREMERLKKQLSTAHDATKRIASEAEYEVNCLCDDKVGLESALKDSQLQLQLTEKQLYSIQKESERKVEDLIKELAAAKKNLEIMMADHDKILNLLDNHKSSEEGLKNTINVFEVNLASSESKCQHLLQEIADLKGQLQKTKDLQNELLDLKNELITTEFEKDNLEKSYRSLSGYCKELKGEKTDFIEKISSLQGTVSELEYCKQTVSAFEDKLRQTMDELVGMETLRAEDAQVKVELSEIKRENEQLQQKILQLEEEKTDCFRKVLHLNQELKLLKEEMKIQNESNKSIPGAPKSGGRVTSKHEDLKFPKNDMVQSSNQPREISRKPSGNTARALHFPKDHKTAKQNEHHREGNLYYPCDTSHALGAEVGSRIGLFDNEASEPPESNNVTKAQLNRLASERRRGHVETANRSSRRDVVIKEKYEQAYLEAELRDIRERYLHMSLKYAEVEAQREELVMKLKGTKSGKSWFS